MVATDTIARPKEPRSVDDKNGKVVDRAKN